MRNISGKKSQVAMEFLILIGFLTVFTFGFIVAAGVQFKDFSDSQKINLVKEMGESVKSEIGLASTVKEGYRREIFLPDKIDGAIGYNISAANSTLIIRAENYEFSAVIPKIEGQLDEAGKSYIISHINNSVKIEKNE